MLHQTRTHPVAIPMGQPMVALVEAVEERQCRAEDSLPSLGPRATLDLASGWGRRGAMMWSQKQKQKQKLTATNGSIGLVVIRVVEEQQWWKLLFFIIFYF